MFEQLLYLSIASPNTVQLSSHISFVDDNIPRVKEIGRCLDRELSEESAVGVLEEGHFDKERTTPLHADVFLYTLWYAVKQTLSSRITLTTAEHGTHKESHSHKITK